MSRLQVFAGTNFQYSRVVKADEEVPDPTFTSGELGE
jgi:hypothetical protein